MKRSEVMRILGPIIEASEFSVEWWEAILEANGRWDPEEPELPKRLIREREFVWNAVDGKGNESFGIIDLSALIVAGLDNLTYRVLHAAFDAYNRLQSGELVDKMEAASIDQIAAHSLGTLLADIGQAVGVGGTAEKVARCTIAKIHAMREEIGRRKLWQQVAENLRAQLDARPMNPAADALSQRIYEAMEYLDPSDTVYRILSGEEP